MRVRTVLATLAFGLALWGAAPGFPPQIAVAQDGKPGAPKEYEDFDKVIADSEKMEGLFRLYRKKERILLEIQSSQLERPYLFVSAISQGIGSGMILGGMTLEDWLLSFRKVGDRIYVVHKNVKFRAQPGSPAAEAVKNAYSDSVIASLRIMSMRPGGSAILVDFSDFMMQDLLDLRKGLAGFYRMDPTRSSMGAVKNFPMNSEFDVNLTFAGEPLNASFLETVPDPRSVSFTAHYSLCALPDTGYKARIADQRVGYFVTALKDYSKPEEEDAFIRYVNRWHLEKADPSAKTSPPKQPIVYWIEKTVPYQYRKYVRAGILEWNKAFEKAGFENAIEVRDQPNNADWDPEDVRYTTFRWMTNNAGFAMGPSRVNPYTGQIFDADIIFDADFISTWQRDYDLFGQKKDMFDFSEGWNERAPLKCGCCRLAHGRSTDMAMGWTALMVRDMAPGGKLPEEIIGQGLKEVVMHEVGHTLGLRHNFKASALYKADELHDTAKTRKTGITASVMDYAPINLAPKGTKQGDYFSDTIGPYDYWAIEYGYKPVSGGSPEGELSELKKIAARSTERELAFSTDEDTKGLDPDPFSNRFDMGSEPLAYAKAQADLIDELFAGKLVDKIVPDGKGYDRVRQVFSMLLGQYGMSLDYAARYVGGVEFHRNHKGDPNGKAPFSVIAPDKQREALNFLKERAFSDKSFQFAPELLNTLAPERWMHWGKDAFGGQIDYPLHNNVLRTQTRVLARLYHPVTLSRVIDNERKCKDENCVTVPDLLRETTGAIWSELDTKVDGKKVTNRQPFVSSFRRGLQREHLKMLVNMSIKPMGGTPEDARTLASATLRQLHQKLDGALKEKDKLDDYSRAHLEESQMRIQKALDAVYQAG